MARVLVTGAAGFIGSHTSAALARDGHAVMGCDNFCAYYSPQMKRQRVQALLEPLGIACMPLDICDGSSLKDAMADFGVDTVVHLAAQAGVRHSAEAPMEFVQANLMGFAQVIEASRSLGVQRFIYASSSSVYGDRAGGRFRESDPPVPPRSWYAATKLANEALAQAHAHQHGFGSVGLRLFTVYGPWGRPDMAALGFARRIRNGEPITLFGDGRLLRDFTYVDDAVHAIARLVRVPLPESSAVVVNVGRGQPQPVSEMVSALEEALGRKAVIEYQPIPASDVPHTCASDERLRALVGEWPAVPLRDGLRRLVRWLETFEPLSPDRDERVHLEPSVLLS